MTTVRRWSVGRLVAAWMAYWAVLALVTLGPALRAAWHATHLPETARSSVDLSMGSGAFSLVIKEHGAATWSGSVGVLPLCLWIAVVPLAMWAVWLAVRGRGTPAEPAPRARAT